MCVSGYKSDIWPSIKSNKTALMVEIVLPRPFQSLTLMLYMQ